MNSRLYDQPELDLADLMSDPMVQLIMRADGIDQSELLDLFDQVAIERRAHPPPAPGTSEANQPLQIGSFRRGVGIMLLNRSGQIFVGQRIDTTTDAWQMPQGGIEPGETPLGAALRELREEIGTSNVEHVTTSQEWLTYEVPRELLDRMRNARWRGQTQQWFLMAFRGQDDEINIATEHPEFSRWQWVPAHWIVELIVPFKRDLYEMVLQQFEPHIESLVESNQRP